MQEIFIQLIKTFGLWITLVLIMLGVLIWYIVHLKAEPGGKVSIFWGMVEYTKGKSNSERNLEPILEENLNKKISPNYEKESISIVESSPNESRISKILSKELNLESNNIEFMSEEYITMLACKSKLLSKNDDKIKIEDCSLKKQGEKNEGI